MTFDRSVAVSHPEACPKEYDCPHRLQNAFERDPHETLRALPRLKKQLSLNVKVGCPADVIPELSGWKDRSLFIRP